MGPDYDVTDLAWVLGITAWMSARREALGAVAPHTVVSPASIYFTDSTEVSSPSLQALSGESPGGYKGLTGDL